MQSLIMCVYVCVCVVSVIIKHPVLPPCAVDGHSRNPLFYYYFITFLETHIVDKIRRILLLNKNDNVKSIH